MKRLTDRQQMFCDAYMQSFSPKKAALEAGYSSANPSKAGFQALQNDNVRNEIQRRMDERKQSLELVPFDAIIQQLVEIASDQEKDSKERMKAMDLLIKYKANNKWGQADMNTVNEYVDALKDQVGDIWGSDA